jgi:peptidoglycan hydrolase-like protein with peptidoglycan-binding domain
VKTLQALLIGKGHLAPGNITGFFGALTRAAVQKFQCEQGIVCSGNEATTGFGIIGPKTLARLQALGGISSAPSTSATPASSSPSLTRPLYQGTTGDDVKTLQALLIGRGHLAPGNITGFFGALTKQAVQKFQCEQNIVCSGTEATTGFGFVGVKTRAKVQALVTGQ